MTLCAAFVDGETIWFASDSRLTLPTGATFDFCSKVVRVPVKLLGSGYEGSPPQPIHEFNIGLALVGNFTAAYSVRELLIELLPQLQVIPELRRASFDIVIEVIRALFESVSRSICETLAEKGIAQLLVGGHCPLQKRVRTFHLTIDSSTFPISVHTNEFAPTARGLFLGSGREAAEKIVSAQPDVSVFHVIKRVIDDPDVPSVGGAIQLGFFRSTEFIVAGIYDYVIDEKERTVTVRRLHRGIDLREFVRRLGAEDLNVAFTAAQPFNAELDRLMAAGYLVRTP